VEGDPLADIRVLADGARLALVVKGGSAVRGRLVPAQRFSPVSA